MKFLSVKKPQRKQIDKRISQRVMVSEWAELLSRIQYGPNSERYNGSGHSQLACVE